MIRVATTSELSWQLNDLLTILLAAVYSGTGNCFPKSLTGALSSNSGLGVR